MTGSPQTGQLTRIPLSDVWKHEALDFTRWLCDHIELITDAVSLDLDNIKREESAGRYSIDIVARSGSDTVIIENQYGKTDHDHLGKLITYASAMDARTAIWVCEEPRSEHVQAVTWLNEQQNTDFWLLKVEALRIDDSKPAPLITVIVGPSDDLHSAGSAKRSLSEDAQRASAYWSAILEIGKQVPGFDWKNSGTKSDSMGKVAMSGRSIYIQMGIQKGGRRIYLDAGEKNAATWNQHFIDSVYDKCREQLKESFATSKKTSKDNVNRALILVELQGSGLTADGQPDPDRCREHAEACVKFESIVSQHLEAAIAAADEAVARVS